MATTLTLYSYWRSSSSWRVRLQLGRKQLAHTIRPVHLIKDGGQQHAPEFLLLNPMRQIPYLRVEDERAGFGIAQSMAIMEYLEEAHPEVRTLPEAPALRARARQLAEIINSGTQPLQNLALIQQLREQTDLDARAFCRMWIERGLRGYRDTMRAHCGVFSVGDEPTIADFCLIPQLYNARRFGVDLAPLGELLEIEQAMRTLNFFEAAHPEGQPDFDPEAAP